MQKTASGFTLKVVGISAKSVAFSAIMRRFQNILGEFDTDHLMPTGRFGLQVLLRSMQVGGAVMRRMRAFSPHFSRGKGLCLRRLERIITAQSAEVGMYIWERANWPHFTWREAELSAKLASTRHLQGRLLGRMEALGFKLREEAVLETLTQDVVTTSEIEGEKLDTHEVRSSLARRLGMDAGALPSVDRHVEGVVDMMLDATGQFRDPLTADRLFGWHAALFPTGRSGISKIRVGCWRDDADGPMQVVSGSYGRERVHYQAPPAERVPGEMDQFLEWMNGETGLDPVIKAAIAHFWFVTIHPFEDGNGRIARALADLALARSEETSQRFYSMSAQIQRERAAYYDLLERQQKSDLDITVWIAWFLNILSEAFQSADAILINVIRKSNFWECASNHPLNARQIKVLNRLLDGFQGKMTSSKWAKIGDCSQDTANRDIAFLIDAGLLRRGPAGGRSTNYELVFQDD